MIHVGLMGYPVAHSFSPRLHEQAFEALGIDGQYHLWEIPPSLEGMEEIVTRIDQLRAGDIRGFNVTIPHKVTILPLVDQLTPRAQAIGAVNTVFLDPHDHAVVGDNTDSPGFWADLSKVLPMGGKSTSRAALVLGAGGGARAVTHALSSRGWRVAVAARRTSQGENLTQQFQDLIGEVETLHLSSEANPESDGFDLVVNATPVGMMPQVDESPWPEGWRFPPRALIYDLVYNPPQTTFLRQAERQGLKTRNGRGMLVEQAALAFERWTGKRGPREVMLEAAP